MRHSLHAEDFGIRLRPVGMEDAAFIVWLRNQDYVKGTLGDSATHVAGQEAWLQAYFERDGDYYFIAETAGGIPFGTHAIYDIRGDIGEKGRHVMRPEILAGVPAGMLATDLAFGKLGLSALRSHSVSTNRAVHSLHRKTGFKQVGIKPAAQMIGGKPVDLVEFLILAPDWPQVRAGLLPLAEMARKQVSEWEKSLPARNRPWL